MQRAAKPRFKLVGALVAVAALGALAVASAARASALSAFHTPGWSAQCYVVGEEAPPTLTCSLPRSGFSVSMQASGRSLTGSNPKDKNYHDVFAARRLLGFNRYWEFRPLFGCVSRSTALTCWNAAGHGWSLSRSGSYRLF
jgi:hypothetical protein